MPLEPGPETDLAVAKACGIENVGILSAARGIYGTAAGDGGCYYMTPIETPLGTAKQVGYKFRPSTDLNDSFLAAEKHPWADSIQIVRTKNLDWYANIGGVGAYAMTPALAICAAILKLAETKP